MNTESKGDGCGSEVGGWVFFSGWAFFFGWAFFSVWAFFPGWAFSSSSERLGDDVSNLMRRSFIEISLDNSDSSGSSISIRLSSLASSFTSSPALSPSVSLISFQSETIDASLLKDESSMLVVSRAYIGLIITS